MTSSYKVFLIFIMSFTNLYAMPSEECIRELRDKKQVPDCLDTKDLPLGVPTSAKGPRGTLYGLRSSLILTKADNHSELLTGDQTQLDNPQSIDWQKDEKEIYVLEESGDLLVFTDFLLGNVAPKRVIKNKDLPGAIDLTIVDGHIIILNPKTKRLLSFDIRANSRAVKGHRHDQVQRVWDTKPEHIYTAISAKSNTEVFLLDHKGRIFFYTDKGIVLISQVSGATDLNYLRESESNQESLIISTPSGSKSIELVPKN